MSNLQIVLKTVERCNLNCSYCYFFNGSDQTYRFRPKFIKRDVIHSLVKFIQDGIKDFNIKSIGISLHGGEPLMQSKDDFVYMLDQFKTLTHVGEGVDVYFTMQTNATLVTKKWVDLLNKYKVYVGISIDGPQEYHDRYRIDHYSNGSYEAVVKGIKLLIENLFTKPGCLTVINPEFDGRLILQAFS